MTVFAITMVCVILVIVLLTYWRFGDWRNSR